MPSDVVYEKNQAGWDAFAVGPEVLAAVEATLRAVEVAAVGLSPRSSEAERAYFTARYGASSPTRYADSFSASTSVATRRGRPRVEGVLRNTSGHAAAVEFGNIRVRRPLHVMARAAASVAVT